MKPIATDISDFEALRKTGKVYVDKTAYLHRLITDPSRIFFFCARPRRFGKSLSVTTLKSIFLGHREYFDGLAIAKTDYDWKPHAVVHFNWGGVEVSDLATFEETFVKAVRRSLAEAGWTYDETLRPSDNLREAIDFFYRRDGGGRARPDPREGLCRAVSRARPPDLGRRPRLRLQDALARRRGRREGPMRMERRMCQTCVWVVFGVDLRVRIGYHLLPFSRFQKINPRSLR